MVWYFASYAWSYLHLDDHGYKSKNLNMNLCILRNIEHCINEDIIWKMHAMK